MRYSDGRVSRAEHTRAEVVCTLYLYDLARSGVAMNSGPSVLYLTVVDVT